MWKMPHWKTRRNLTIIQLLQQKILQVQNSYWDEYTIPDLLELHQEQWTRQDNIDLQFLVRIVYHEDFGATNDWEYQETTIHIETYKKKCLSE